MIERGLSRFLVSLRPLTLAECEQVRLWRNASLESLRTPFALTEEMQAEFFRTVVSNRASVHRYWGVHVEVSPKKFEFVGCAGLTNIQWENGNAELSLIIDPSRTKSGFGRAAVRLLLDEAFLRLRLEIVLGEVYQCNEAFGFWKKISKAYAAYETVLPDRKFFGGRLWNALYFSISRKNFFEVAV